MLLYVKYYIIHYLWTGIIDCKSCHTIETFELVLSFFSLYNLAKFMFIHTDSLWKKKYSESDLYEAVSAYISRIYKYMYVEENIFVSLAKSALNI